MVGHVERLALQGSTAMDRGCTIELHISFMHNTNKHHDCTSDNHCSHNEHSPTEDL